MQSLLSTLYYWQAQASVITLLLCAVMLFHYATKLWSAPLDAILGTILGASIGIACALLFFYRHLWHIAIGTRASCFIALFIWCVLVMLFFAAKETRRAKLCLGIVSQAGILYALFVYL